MNSKVGFSNDIFMRFAIKEALKAYEVQEVPVGAIIVSARTKRIIASAHNQVEETHIPTAHAEVLAIYRACKELGTSRLSDCDLYVTLEPCPMCAYAISLSRIRRLYFATPDPKSGGVENGPAIFNSKSCHHRPEIYGGICESKASEILKRFFDELR